MLGLIKCRGCGHVFEAVVVTVLRHREPQPVDPCPEGGWHGDNSHKLSDTLPAPRTGGQGALEDPLRGVVCGKNAGGIEALTGIGRHLSGRLATPGRGPPPGVTVLVSGSGVLSPVVPRVGCVFVVARTAAGTRGGGAGARCSPRGHVRSWRCGGCGHVLAPAAGWVRVVRVRRCGVLSVPGARLPVMNDYSTAWDALATAIGAAKGKTSGSITEIDHLTVDQQLKVAEVAALLSIAQELSGIRNDGINPEFSPG